MSPPRRLDSTILIGALLAASAVALAPKAAHAQSLLPFESTRGLGMGGAVRASATGSAGPLVNPSGMSLIRSYTLEGAYQVSTPGPEHVGHASIVDSTSGYNVAGGLYYTYLNARRKVGDESVPLVKGHEVGLALSLPFGDRLAVGATGKYNWLDQAGTNEKGFTVDTGLTLRPIPVVSLGVVGYNLVDTDNAYRPRALGWGVALSAVPGLLLEFDGLVDLRDEEEARGEISLMGGAEYVVGQRFALRAGGGRDGVGSRGHVNGGISILSEVGALDVGLRRDVSGTTKETTFAASLRLFVPSP